MNSTNGQKRGIEYGVLHFNNEILANLDHGLGLAQFLYQFFELQKYLKFIQFEELIQLGAVYLNEKRINLDTFHSNSIKSNPLSLRIHTIPRRCPLMFYNLNWQKRIVFQHPDFYLIDKPSQLDVHAQVDNIRENLIYFLNQTFKENLLVTNRLDRDTCGLIILARNSQFQKFFNQSLRENKILKIYQVIVWGIVDQSVLGLKTHFMKNTTYAPKELVDIEIENSLKCELRILDYKCNRELNISILEIELLTGRTHQIRAQLSKMGFSIVGDPIYSNSLTEQPEYVRVLSHLKNLNPEFNMGLSSKRIAFYYHNELFKFDLNSKVVDLFE